MKIKAPRNFGVSEKLEAKLKEGDPEVRYFVAALPHEAVKLKKEIAKLEVKNSTLNKGVDDSKLQLRAP